MCCVTYRVKWNEREWNGSKGLGLGLPLGLAWTTARHHPHSEHLNNRVFIAYQRLYLQDIYEICSLYHLSLRHHASMSAASAASTAASAVVDPDPDPTPWDLTCVHLAPLAPSVSSVSFVSLVSLVSLSSESLSDWTVTFVGVLVVVVVATAVEVPTSVLRAVVVIGKRGGTGGIAVEAEAGVEASALFSASFSSLSFSVLDVLSPAPLFCQVCVPKLRGGWDDGKHRVQKGVNSCMRNWIPDCFTEP